MELLECKGISKGYGDKEILKSIDLTITRGKIIGLLGKNGAGKTTLIKTSATTSRCSMLCYKHRFYICNY